MLRQTKKYLRAFRFYSIIRNRKVNNMTIKQQKMLQNLSKIKGFSFNDDLQIGTQIIKLKEIETLDIPYQNEIINEIMKNNYKKITKITKEDIEAYNKKCEAIQKKLDEMKKNDFEFWAKYSEKHKDFWQKKLNELLGKNK